MKEHCFYTQSYNSITSIYLKQSVLEEHKKLDEAEIQVNYEKTIRQNPHMQRREILHRV